MTLRSALTIAAMAARCDKERRVHIAWNEHGPTLINADSGQLRIGVSAPPAPSGSGSATVALDPLSAALAGMAPSVTLTVAGTRLVLTDTDTEASIPIVNPLPEPAPMGALIGSVAAPAKDIRGWLGRVLPAVAPEGAGNPSLTGAAVEIASDGTARAIGTDGNRLHCALLPFAVTGHAPEGMRPATKTQPARLGTMLPRRDFLQAVTATKADGDALLWWSDRRVQYAAGPVTISGSMLAEDFPDWGSVMPNPSDFTAELVADRDALLRALRRVRWAARDTSALTVWTLTSGAVSIGAKDHDWGSMTSTAPAAWTGTAGRKVGLSAALTLTTLAAFDPGPIRMRFTNPLGPIVVERIGASDFAILMPCLE